MKISVIIPVYNSNKTINKCLDSVLKQSYKNWEAIVIDDGSIDDSYEIMKLYSYEDSRIKIYSQENSGPGSTRNKGIDKSTGDYIVFLDSDDYINQYYFEEIINCEFNEHSDVIFIDVIQENPNGTIIKEELMSSYIGEDKETIIKHQMTGKLPWGGCRKAVRAKLIKDNEIRYSNDIVGEEAIFSFNTLFYAKKVSFIPKCYYHYVNYDDSQSKKGNEDPWGCICKKMKKYLIEKNLFENYKIAINSFAYTACIVSIQRISKLYNFFDAIKLSKKALGDFKSTYSLDIDKELIDKRAVLMLPFVKLNIPIMIVIVAKIKQLIKI